MLTGMAWWSRVGQPPAPLPARFVVAAGLLAATLAGAGGCTGAPIPPTYTQEELRAACERHGGWWHSDDLTGGFCEPIHS